MNVNTRVQWAYKEDSYSVTDSFLQLMGVFEDFYEKDCEAITQAVHAMASVRLDPGTPYTVVVEKNYQHDFGRTNRIRWSTYVGLTREALVHQLAMQGQVFVVVGGCSVATIEEAEKANVLC